MNKHVKGFLPSFLLITLLVQPPVVTSGQQSKGLLGRREVLIINNSGRLLRVDVPTSVNGRYFQLRAGGDVILENVKVIRVAGTDYPLKFKNRYELLWDEQGKRAYLMELVRK